MPSGETLTKIIEMPTGFNEWITMKKTKLRIVTKWCLTLRVKEHRKPRHTTWKRGSRVLLQNHDRHWLTITIFAVKEMKKIMRKRDPQVRRVVEGEVCRFQR